MSKKSSKKDRKVDEGWYLGFGEPYREMERADQVIRGGLEPYTSSEPRLEDLEPASYEGQEGWIDYGGYLREGAPSTRSKPRMSETTISKSAKIYAIAGSIFGISLLISGRLLEAGLILGVTAFVYMLSRRGAR